MTERTLRGGRPIPDDYPLTAEEIALAQRGDCIADVPAEHLERLVAYYGSDPHALDGEPVPDDAELV